MKDNLAYMGLILLFVSGGFAEGENYIAAIISMAFAILLMNPYMRSIRNMEKVEERRRKFDAEMERP